MKKLITILGFAVISVAGVQAQVVISNSNPYTENFNGLGSNATATLPTGFRAQAGASPTWSGGNVTSTTLAYGTTGTGVVTGTSPGGLINWGNGTTSTATDRALGILNTGSFTSPQSIMFSVTNNTGLTVLSLDLSWAYQKYRSGSRAFTWNFFSSTDGSTWASQSSGDLAYAADVNNTVVSNPPLITSSPTFSLTGLSLANGASYYLRWTLTGTGGSTNGQGLGIDNFSITANTVPEPQTWVLIGIGSAFMLWNLRRKRRV